MITKCLENVATRKLGTFISATEIYHRSCLSMLFCERQRMHATCEKPTIFEAKKANTFFFDEYFLRLIIRLRRV
jgi:hypothetical protein